MKKIKGNFEVLSGVTVFQRGFAFASVLRVGQGTLIQWGPDSHLLIVCFISSLPLLLVYTLLGVHTKGLNLFLGPCLFGGPDLQFLPPSLGTTEILLVCCF